MLKMNEYEGIRCMDGLIVPFIKGGGPYGLQYTTKERFLYGVTCLLILIYLFICVGFITDAMMSRFQKLTSKSNKTVANFTLLSFGWTAPQMQLAFFEIISNQFESGDLGVSAIIGSAAYRIFVVIGYLVFVCQFVVPHERINNVRVLIPSSIFFLFSMTLLYFISCQISPSYIQIWEAVILILPYPFVVIILYISDRFCKKNNSNSANETIALNEGHAGTFSFKQSHVEVKTTGLIEIIVKRDAGYEGQVTLPFITQYGTDNYQDQQGNLIFENLETEKPIGVTIDNVDNRAEIYINLGQPIDSGAKLGEQNKMKISIENRIVIMNARNIVRLIALPWSFIFDILPVSESCCNTSSKKTCYNILITVLTFFLAYFILMPIFIVLLLDISSHLGCFFYLKDSESGILLLTLGFCIPSTISTRNAIKNGATVDDIVSQMIGSNIMSVFLGIGLPWLMGAIYHASMSYHQALIVIPNAIKFKLGQFSGYWVAATLILVSGSLVRCRRQRKLQDNIIWRILCFICFFLFWLLFVLASFLEAYGVIKDPL